MIDVRIYDYKNSAAYERGDIVKAFIGPDTIGNCDFVAIDDTTYPIRRKVFNVSAMAIDLWILYSDEARRNFIGP